MSPKFSRFISFIFNPIILPIYMALIVIYTHPRYFNNEGIQNDVLMLYVFGIMFLLPAVGIFLMKQLDFIDSFKMEQPKQRFIPMIAITTFWLWSYFMFKEGGGYATSSYFPLGKMILGCVASMFILFPMNFISKISWNVVGSGALISLILNIFQTSIYNLTILFILAILVVGLTASAQLTLGRCKKNELMTSFLIGFFGQFFAFRVWDLFAF